MAKKILLILLDFYQINIRAYLPLSCRFEPSCSEYTKQAILKYGPIRGLLKAIKRISTCHPFSRQSGYQPLK